MLIILSFMLVVSIAALKISQTKFQGDKESDGSHLEHEFEERESNTANATNVIQNDEEKKMKIEMPKILLTQEFEECNKVLIGGEKMDYATEKELLQNLIQKYKQRELNLERKLVEWNSIKKQQSEISQLQRELEKKEAKLDSLEKTLASIKSETKIIQEKIREGVLCKVEVDIANNVINEMQREKGVKGSLMKDQILMLQKQVVELRKHNGLGRNSMVSKKLEEAKEMELEVLELKRRNKEIELEKREMGVKLVTTQARFRTEEETMAQLQEEITGLQHVHEELSEQVETLQRSRFNMVQELVYQRWLYTCLRYELHNHQKRASREYAKTQTLTSDSELDINISSNESDEIETTTLGSSSSSQTSISSKNSSLISRMKRWKRISSRGENSPGRHLIHRFSISTVESDLSKPRTSYDGDDSPIINVAKPLTQLKRVSFSDSVKPSCYVTDQGRCANEERSTLCLGQNNMAEVIEDVIDVKETNFGQIVDEHKAKECDGVCNAKEYVVGDSVKNDSPTENESVKNQKNGHLGELCSKNEVIGRMHQYRIKRQLVAFFFFLLILLLVYFRIK